MKKNILFSIIIISFLLLGCNDQDNVILSTPESSTPILSAENSIPGLMKLTIRESGQQAQTKILIPMDWDGKSPLISGTYYHFNGLNELEEAIILSGDTYLLSLIEKMKNIDLKRKADINTKLAYGSWDAQASVTTDEHVYHCYATTSNPSDQSGCKTHILIFRDLAASENLYYDKFDYYGQSALTLEAEKYYGCLAHPIIGAYAQVFHNSTLKASDEDVNECD